MRELKAHGTEAAYSRHNGEGSAPCQLCLVAHATYNRAGSRAQSRARSRLVTRHRAEYLALLAEERAAG